MRNRTDSVVFLSIALIAFAIVSSPILAGYFEAVSQSQAKPLVVTMPDGTERKVTDRQGQQLYEDPNMEAHVVFGRDAVYIYNKATQEGFFVRIENLKSNVYKK